MNIALQITQLTQMTLPELQNLWKRYFDEKPLSLNREFYVSRLAYKIQELHFGGLPIASKNLLVKMADNAEIKNKRKLPPIGTRIVRIFKGQEYVVKIMVDGFDFNGLLYKSLSQIAQKITGQKISGYRFFKLEGDCDDTKED